MRLALLFALCVLGVAGSPGAWAEPPHFPPTEAAAGPSYLGEPKETYQVFVFGDSLAAGLFAGMSRMAEGDLRISIDGRFKDDSGLARLEFYDWAAALPKIQERRNIDIAVILLGSNDGQDMRSATSVISFSTPDWATTYAQRLDEIVAILRSKGTAVYWIELPPMGPEPLELETKYVATIQRDRIQKQKVRYIEIRKAFTDDEDRYTDQGVDVDGKQTRLRTRDGIHFLKSGNNKLGKLVLDAIRRDIDIADGKAAEPLTTPAAVASETETKPSLPLFGQMAGAKNEVGVTIFEADPTWASAVIAINRGAANKADSIVTPQTLITSLKERVPPGSSASRLFAEGKWPESRPGRFDDFSWPRQP
jgi:hypothetical protein